MEYKNANSINYLEIIKQAFQVTWKNRYLWWFGFLISLSGFGSFSQSFSNKENGGGNTIGEQKFSDFISQNFHWILIGAIIMLFIYAALVIAGLISRGALVYSISREFKGEKSNFKNGFRIGREYFGRIFLIAIASGLLIFSAAIVIALPVMFLFFNHNYVIGVLMAILAAIILIPIVILAIYLRTFGYIYAVLGDLKFWPALENACNLFQKNILSSIMMGLIFIPVGLILAIGALMAIIPVAIIFLVIGIILFLIIGKLGAIIAMIIAAVCVLPILLITRSFYEVFKQAAWIIFFESIAKTKMEEPIAEPVTEPKPISKPLPITDADVVE
jgi:hypothetical protein